MKSLYSVCRRYEAALRRQLGDRVDEAKLWFAVQRFRVAQERNRQVMRAVSELLSGTDQPRGLDVSTYIAFALRLDKLKRERTGETLVREAASLVDLWSSRGLNRQVLDRICREVFSLDLDK